MPDFTTNYALPYPAATDEPCDFAEQWCDFTQALDAVLDEVQATVDRIYPTIKVTVLRLDTLTTFTGTAGTPVIFDTVDIDTADWSDPVTMDRIDPDIGGFVTLVGNLTFQSKAVGQNSLSIASGESGIAARVNVFNVSGSGCGLYAPRQAFDMSTYDHVNGFFRLEIDDSSADTPMGVEHATLAVFWHSDV